jgi:tRNA 5-methylaminomethyl-2-thiouridine biosynthesis bifunctional protein
LVICAGAQTPELFPQAWLAPGERLRLKPIRGQVSHLPAAAITSPSAVICGSRYINPQHDGIAVTGATFDLRDGNPLPTTASHQENLTELNSLLPGILNAEHQALAAENLQGRVAFRCTTHDYQPVVGAVGTHSMTMNGGAWMFTGLGSKGLTYAPLLAEYLADRMCSQPAALPHALARRLRVKRVLQQE